MKKEKVVFMAKQNLLYDSFYYDVSQEEVEAKENTKICELHDQTYNAILVKPGKLYNELDAKLAFYFKNSKLKRIVFMIENNNFNKIIDIIQKQGYIATIGGESKNISTLFAGFIGSSKNIKLFDFIEEEKKWNEFKADLNKKPNKFAHGIIFFKGIDIEKADCYAQLYENISDDAIAIYMNIDSFLSRIYVGFCVPKKELMESI